MKVLVYVEAWGQGGIESFLMNMFRCLQNNGFEFVLFSTWEWNSSYDSELCALGIERYSVFNGYRPGQLKRLREGSAAFERILKKRQYDAVYVNTMNGMGFLYSEVARRRGVPVRLVHSHNSTFGPNMTAAKTVAHKFAQLFLSGSATACLACSDDAGRYLFNKKPFVFVNNGIDTRRFAFDPNARERIRCKLGIPASSFLAGSIGRVSATKNPLFQVRAFAEIKKLDPFAHYLMVGDGDMRSETEELVVRLGLEESFHMTGYLPDPAPYFSALDVFLMPSLFEGLPFAVVESQCSGCSVLASGTLPKEVGITDLVRTMPLEAGEGAWASVAVEMGTSETNRLFYSERVARAGFSADDASCLVAKILNAGDGAGGSIG